jgi:hypothetical protein
MTRVRGEDAISRFEGHRSFRFRVGKGTDYPPAPMNRLAARAFASASFALLVGAACGGSTLAGPGAGGAACGPCSYVYTNGGIACGDGPGGPAAMWETLARCACMGPCTAACNLNFCQSMPADMTCGMCLSASCSAELMACAAN